MSANRKWLIEKQLHSVPKIPTRIKNNLVVLVNFGRIDYFIEPGEVGSGWQFESKVTGGNVPPNTGLRSKRF